MGFFQNSSSFRMIFGIIMVIIYMVMGYIFAVVNPMELSKPFGLIIGIILIIYGVFRGIRLWKKGF